MTYSRFAGALLLFWITDKYYARRDDVLRGYPAGASPRPTRLVLFWSGRAQRAPTRVRASTWGCGVILLYRDVELRDLYKKQFD